MSTCRVTYSNGIIYFVLRIILNAGFSIITDSDAVFGTSLRIVTKSNRIITIMCCTVTNSYTLNALRCSTITDGYASCISFTFIIWARSNISTSTHSNAVYSIWFSTLTNSNGTSCISLGISCFIICCIRCAFIIIFRIWICRADSNRLITCC